MTGEAESCVGGGYISSDVVTSYSQSTFYNLQPNARVSVSTELYSLPCWCYNTIVLGGDQSSRYVACVWCWLPAAKMGLHIVKFASQDKFTKIPKSSWPCWYDMGSVMSNRTAVSWRFSGMCCYCCTTVRREGWQRTEIIARLCVAPHKTWPLL